MKSIQLVSQRKLELRLMALPADPGPGEVLVRLRAIGICGSDMHWYKEGGIGSSPAAYPQVLGHEPAGEIAAVGKGVAGGAGWKRGGVGAGITFGPREVCMAGAHHNLGR